MGSPARTRDEILQKAAELGMEYEIKYVGCAPSTFCAVVDALRWGGLEVVPQDYEDRLFEGLAGLAGGVGICGEGSCGCVSGATVAISLALGVPREEQSGRDARTVIFQAVQRAVVDPFTARFGSLLCKDIQRSLWGKAYDLRVPEARDEFLREGGTFDLSERVPSRWFCKTTDCIISHAARWACAEILDLNDQGRLRGAAAVEPG
jgi:hypothetical protein